MKEKKTNFFYISFKMLQFKVNRIKINLIFCFFKRWFIFMFYKKASIYGLQMKPRSNFIKTYS